MPDTWLIVNPSSRRADAAVAAVLHLAPDARVLTTTPDDPGRGQARRAVEAGAARVVVAGGDGTVRQVAGGLAGSGVPLGVVPIGSGNVLAWSLGIRRPAVRDLVAAVDLALSAPPRPVDLGWATCHPVGGDVVGPEPFLTMVGIGHDAATVARLTPGLKRRLGPLAYFAAGLRPATARASAMTLSVDDGPPVASPSWSVLVANVGRVPPGVTIAPTARPDDGVLDVVRVAVDRPWHWGPVAGAGLLGLPHDLPRLLRARASRVVIAADPPRPVQLDGDVVPGVGRLEVALSPRTLLVRRP